MSAAKASLEDMLKPLAEAQALAVDPAAHVWLNASAGTGKTQVLAARVLRLLLGGVAPDAILCITFTKAGAAEMAKRVHERLALWVGCSEQALRTDLSAIGLNPLDTDLQWLARTLFARVIDSPAGAIRVQTIHSFCQALLASFPFEAGVLPGFRLIEGGEANDLRSAVLADMLRDPGQDGARWRAQLGLLSRALGEDAALRYLNSAANWFQRRPDPRLAPRANEVRLALGLPTGDADAWVADQLAAGVVDDDDIAQLMDAWRGWGTATAQKYLHVAASWTAAFPADRGQLLLALYKTMCTDKAVLNQYYCDGSKRGKLLDVAPVAQRVSDACVRLLQIPAQCRLADDLAAGWGLAADYAAALAKRKQAEGYAEYDDLIARTAALLANGELADWILFKLDQRIDHLLIDEAQDTNADQWTIAEGLTGEFFAGLGARGNDRAPSMFTVGDRKQAIFGFQGTDPVAFEAARTRFLARADAAGTPFVPVDLGTNFRSAPAVLDFVDSWLGSGGIAAMGIAPPVALHEAYDGSSKAGRVELWPPLVVGAAGGDDSGDDDDRDGGDGGASGADDSLRAATDPASLKLAAALAVQVAGWIANGIDGAAVQPGDVMILVRSRRSLAARIVAQLQARGVPVAGVDRFALADPLAVQDLLAALRFMVQPDDEHSLAVLLVSPLVGWDHDQLYAETAARGRTPLRQWLAQSDSPAATAANARLAELRGAADLETPFRTLDRILSGPLQGRRAMAARLGAQANDAIDALLAEALAYEARAVATLTGFVDHIDRAPRDIKRPAGGTGLVRVMTVHGSKGLQAPIVILADAATDPTKKEPEVRLDIAGWRGLPLFGTSRAARPPLIGDAWAAARAAQLEEHWRLFYVAATRAERLLVITGTKAKAEAELSEHSWQHAAEMVLATQPHAAVDIGWEAGPALRLSSAPGLWARSPLGKVDRAAVKHSALAVPAWALREPAAEARPPRPLAPSRLGADDAPQRPASGNRAAAIRRGIMLHALIERLPAIAPSARAAAAERWLAAQDKDLTATARAAMASEACAVLAYPDWAALFGPGSLAEAPFSAVIEGGLVIAGTADRLLVTADEVLVVDYKTGAQVPVDAAAVAPAYLRQMAAYAAALGVIFPGRRVAAALLYTAAPRLIALPDALLAAHKPGLAADKANYGSAGVEPAAPTP